MAHRQLKLIRSERKLTLLEKNDGNNEAIDAKDTRHDDRHDRLHDHVWLEDTHRSDADA